MGRDIPQPGVGAQPWKRVGELGEQGGAAVWAGRAGGESGMEGRGTGETGAGAVGVGETAGAGRWGLSQAEAETTERIGRQGMSDDR